jgi:hypothetical protein
MQALASEDLETALDYVDSNEFKEAIAKEKDLMKAVAR